MVQISEKTSDGGDPNKNPQEEANQNENAIQQLQNLKTKRQKQLQNLPNLPEELREIILARIPRDRYPKLYLASKAFGHIFTSPTLFETRSSLGRTECVLYAFIGFPSSDELRSSWYILHRINNSLRLSIIDSLPSMILGSSVVTIGHEIYIIGGNVKKKTVSTGFAIDCRFHTWRCLPNMRRARHHAAAGVIDGMIYVIGGCTKQDEDNWIEVFDVKNQIWETVPSSNPVVMEENIHILDGIFGPNAVMEENIHILDGLVGPNVVMEDKIYIWDGLYCFAYEPRRRRWESWGIGSSQRSIWPMSCCVVDGMLYSINPTCSLGFPIVVYDPRDVVWRPVKGVSRTDLLNLVYYESKMANFGGKLVILGRGQSLNSYGYYKETDIGCIVIALERRDNDEIWGKVESKSCVLTCKKLPFVEHSRTVTV